ncbi:MAG: hypothetical protein WD751_02760 [Anaerolineales bacterium]
MSYHSAKDPEEELPDWLKALRKRQNQESPEPAEPAPEPAAAPDAASEAPGEEEPGWLQEIRSRYGREKGPIEEAPMSEEPALGDTQPHRVSKPEGEEPQPEKEEVEWVPEEFDSEGESTPEPEALSTPVIEEPEDRGYTPAFTTNEEPISPGELPSWLQALRPGAFPKEDTRSGEMLPGGETLPGEIETGGPLAGLSDVLPAEPDLGLSGKPPVFSARLDVTQNQQLHAAALKQLVDEEAKSIEDESRRVALPTRVLNMVMGAALLAAVLFPLLTQSRTAVRPDANSGLFPEVQSLHDLIDVLPAGAPVLVAFEVQPATFGEITPLATAVLNHLLDRQSALVFISTLPTGPSLAEKLLQDQLGALPAVATGDYVNLGYLSGGIAALRSFIGDPRGVTLSSSQADPWQDLQALDQLSDFALIVVVSSGAEELRAWIEQSGGDLPNGLLAVTSQQANPLLRAYLQTDPRTLRGLVSGVQGAALYERMRAQNSLGSSYWDAYSYGLGAMVLLILLGGLYGRLITLRPEKVKPAGSSRAA